MFQRLQAETRTNRENIGTGEEYWKEFNGEMETSQQIMKERLEAKIYTRMEKNRNLVKINEGHVFGGETSGRG